MLYRDYSRQGGEWIPNMYGGRENLEAIGFLRHFNAVVGERCPGAITIAEESTAWPGVSRPIREGGLGFSFKWNMGWMHDTLHYMEDDPVYRAWHHNDMTFGLIYAFAENFVLPLSHDEVVYGKGSLIPRCQAIDWQRFANLRAYFGFMWGHPGKKLLFMGGEIAQEREWSHDGECDWDVLDDPSRRGVQRWCATSTASMRASRHCTSVIRVHGLPLGDRRRPGELGVRVPALWRRGVLAGAGGLQHDAGAAVRLSDRRAAPRSLARAAQHRRRRSTAAPTWATPAWCPPPRCSATARRSRWN